MDAVTTPVTLLGVPLDLGAKNLGVDIGPEAFRHQGIIDKLQHIGLQINDAGNITVRDRKELEVGNPRLRYLDEIVRVNEEVARQVETAIRRQSKIIVLGGDHSLNLGVMSGASAALNGQLGLIYFDAHGDMNTDQTTLTGNIHGMHLAAVMGFGAPQLTHLHQDTIKLDKENLLHIGGSDFDDAELDLIQTEGLQAFTLFDLLTKGMGELIKLIDDLTARVPHIWISLDLDSIDQIYAPGAGMPNAKGLSYREISTLAEYIGRKSKVAGIDVVEYNPLKDDKNKTAELGIELIAKFLGKNYSWYSNYLDNNLVGT